LATLLLVSLLLPGFLLTTLLLLARLLLTTLLLAGFLLTTLLLLARLLVRILIHTFLSSFDPVLRREIDCSRPEGIKRTAALLVPSK
jgi:hypothetical protein